MKRLIGVSISILMTIVFLLPVNQASALGKIDPDIFRLGIDSDEVVGVFVELDKPTVVMHETFGGEDNVACKRNDEAGQSFHKNRILTGFTIPTETHCRHRDHCA